MDKIILGGEVVIPSTVTAIGDSAFVNYPETSSWSSYVYHYNQIEKLTFAPSSQLETIGEYAFQYNALSGELVIPASVKTIGMRSFLGTLEDDKLGITNGISRLVFEEGSQIETIEDYAFEDNQISGELVIPANNVTIGFSSFKGNNITEVILPRTAVSIGGGAFYGNEITNLVVPKEISSIGNEAFSEVGNLTIENCSSNICSGKMYGKISKLIIQNGDVPAQAFYRGNISELYLADVTSIGNEAFLNCNLTGTLIIPNTVTTIGDYAFGSNSYSPGIEIPNTISELIFEEGSRLTTIGIEAFYNQINGELVLPNSVTTIGYQAFDGSPITSLTLGSKITSIGRFAFVFVSLATVYVDMTESDFLKITDGVDWYFGNNVPTIKYKEA